MSSRSTTANVVGSLTIFSGTNYRVLEQINGIRKDAAWRLFKNSVLVGQGECASFHSFFGDRRPVFWAKSDIEWAEAEQCLDARNIEVEEIEPWLKRQPFPDRNSTQHVEAKLMSIVSKREKAL